LITKSNSAKIQYGKGLYELILKREFDILKREEKEPLINPKEEFLKQFDNPISERPLKELLKGKKDILIVVSDISRPVPNKLILEALLPYLYKCGFSNKNISFIIASGSHDSPTDQGIIEILGEDIKNNFKIYNNECSIKEDFESVGYIENGIDVKINKKYINADFKIITGLLNPHPYAGYSGGRKSIVPGLCNKNSWELFHGVDVIGHSQTMVDSLEHSPFHRIANSVMRKAGVDFLINVACTIDHKINGIFCGDAQDAFFTGVCFMRENYRIKTTTKYDISITNGSGYPLDNYFHQLIKGMSTPVPYTKKDGEIICFAKCEKGIGEGYFYDLFKKIKNLKEWRKDLENREFVMEQWTMQAYQRLFSNTKVKLFSPIFNIEPDLKNFIEEINNAEEYLNNKINENPDIKIGVFLDGPDFV
jgi:lactate racemase